MALSTYRFPPRTIWLGGNGVEVGDLTASEAITPGMLVERFNNSGTTQFRKSTLANGQNSSVALNRSYLNQGVDDDIPASDMMEVLVGSPGTTVWGLVASGANIAAGAALGDAGNGYFKAYASGPVIARAVEACDNSAGPGTKRIKVEFQ